jgi:Flp pilus assembly protein TadB
MQTLIIVIAIWVVWALLSWVLHAFKWLVIVAAIATVFVLVRDFRSGRQRL